MPSFGGWEFLVVVIAALLILGPTKLPELARTCALWMGRIRRMYNNFKQEIEQEVGMDEIRQQLHNEQIMAEMKSLERETHSILQDSEDSIRIANSKLSSEKNETIPPAKSKDVG